MADGIGGYSCGEIAAKVVCDSFLDGFEKSMTIEQCTALASQNLMNECKSLGVQKMGSTIAGVVLNSSLAHIFWSGDSRVYVFRDKEIIYVTQDHSMLNELSKIRNITFEERQKYGHIITRSLMGREDDCVEQFLLEIKKDDEILICSDGIYKECPIEFIIDSIRKGTFEIDQCNEDFDDNHSYIYINI